MNKSNKGVRVLHDFDDFVEDREIVLTLKDSYILQNEKILDEDDMLENIELSEAYKSQVDQENRTKKVLSYEDKSGAERKILPQYDEKKRFKDGILLDTEGEYNLEKIRQRESIKAKLAGKSTDKKEINLETSKTVASEYMNAEEMKKFKIPMKKPQNNKKSKEDIIAFLESSLKEEDDDHGNREIMKQQREKVELQDMITKKQKMENYETALDKAREKTKYSRFYEEEYDELESAIEKTRRQTQAKEKSTKVEDIVKSLLSNSAKEPSTAPENGKNLIEVMIEKPKPKEDETIEELTTVNTTTDFLTAISANADDSKDKEVKIPAAKAMSVRDSRSGTASILNVSLPSEKILAWTKSNPGITSILNKKKDDAKPSEGPMKETFTETELEEMKKEVAFVEEEEVIGVAAALKKLREKGYMQPASFEISGRTKEKTVDEEFKKFGSEFGKNIKLEYRDEKGKLMTPKEAFRFQCWAFHGKRPGAVKRRKRLQKELEEKKQKSIAPDQTITMRALQKVQQETNQPYAILNLKTPK